MAKELERSNTTTTFSSFFGPSRKPSSTSRQPGRPEPPPNYRHVDDDVEDDPRASALDPESARRSNLRASKLGLVERLTTRERIDRWNELQTGRGEGREEGEPGQTTPLEKWRLHVANEVAKERRREQSEARQRQRFAQEQQEGGDRVTSWKPSVVTTSSMRSAAVELERQLDSSSREKEKTLSSLLIALQLIVPFFLSCSIREVVRFRRTQDAPYSRIGTDFERRARELSQRRARSRRRTPILAHVHVRRQDSESCTSPAASRGRATRLVSRGNARVANCARNLRFGLASRPRIRDRAVPVPSRPAAARARQDRYEHDACDVEVFDLSRLGARRHDVPVVRAATSHVFAPVPRPRLDRVLYSVISRDLGRPSRRPSEGRRPPGSVVRALATQGCRPPRSHTHVSPLARNSPSPETPVRGARPPRVALEFGRDLDDRAVPLFVPHEL